MKTQLAAFGAILLSIVFYLSLLGIVVSIAMLVIGQDVIALLPLGVFTVITLLFLIAFRINPKLKKAVVIFIENNSTF